LEDYSAAKDIKAELDCLRARLEQLGDILLWGA
jgi:hypothetical protein